MEPELERLAGGLTMGLSRGPNLQQLSDLQAFCSDHNILICLNGPNSQSLIEEVGKALRQHIASQTETTTAMDVFSIYIEMSQNIRNYVKLRNYDAQVASATVVIASYSPGHYSVSAANLIDAVDGPALLARISELGQLSKSELRQRYKQQLRSQDHGGEGAGLGLIDMARRASEPMVATVEQRAGGHALFALRVAV